MKYNEYRRHSRTVRVGDLAIGGTSLVTVQSMTNTDPHDFNATLAQIHALQSAGCDIVRMSLPDMESVEILRRVKASEITVPIVADIHFDYKIALAAADAGVDKIRINPQNIGGRDKISQVVSACRERNIPIRIGVNSGSVQSDLLKKYGGPTAEALAESALCNARLLEELDFFDTVISVKSSDTRTMIRANRIIAEKTDYPIHLGVTEAGFGISALTKSAAGIGALLSEGIGDTVRVSLTEDPCREIDAARSILSALSVAEKPGLEIVSCPTCGRTKIDLISLATRFESEARRRGIHEKNIKVALMGCAVNGPGEAREADVGIAGGDGCALLFKKGVPIEKIDEKFVIDRLIAEILSM